MHATTPTSQKLSSAGDIRSILLLGLLPLVVYWLVERFFGLTAGVIASVVFGVGEVAWEWKRYKRVSTTTWASNGLVIGLGIISLIFNDGIWIKLQPVIMEGIFGLIVIGTTLAGKPLLTLLMKNHPALSSPSPAFQAHMKAMQIRLGIVMLLHAAVVAWAAFHASTDVWIFAKGVLFFIFFGIQMLVEVIWSRWVIAPRIRDEHMKAQQAYAASMAATRSTSPNRSR